MSLGIVASTPVWIPLAIVGLALGCGYGSYRLFKLKRKIAATPVDEEALFTDSEAKIVENIIKRLSKKGELEGKS